ncbi:glutamic acid-rich protein-like [Clytia hemisphaerica]|uniref:Uncharacterized protein n=1 Tax=Clytia hemisphaerica TaxID=252671 RepID=A0A7M5XKR9_9CNID
MSLRKGVLLRSHRKSISEMDMKTRNANTLDGTYTKEKKETKKIIEKDEASPQKQSKHNKSKTKSKETKKQHHQQQQQQQNNRETSIPIAQSTLIHTPVATAKEKKLSISMIDESGIDFLKNENQNEKTLIEMALEDGDDEKQEKPTDEKNRNKENKMPVSSQENIDSLMEYKYKVERLCGILGQFQEQHHEVVNNYQKVIKENKESREKLNLTLFELESDKYLLQQNVQELTEENLKKSTEIESLKQRIEELEKERAEHMEKEQQRECEETERLKALELEREKEELERKEKEEKEEKEKAQRNITGL